MKKYILYHAQCPDGFGAAYSIWKKEKHNNIIYIAVQHSFPLPNIENDSIVWLVDFCYSHEIMADLATKMKEILIIDHHQSAVENMENFDYQKHSNVKAIFDMKKSGAVLTWEYVHQSEAPLFLQYVQDKDLWQFNLPQSKEFSAALRAYPMDFVLWDKFIVEDLIKEGNVLIKYQTQMVDKLCKNARLAKIASYEVMLVNSAVLQSEIGNQLCKQYPKTPFSVVYFDVANQRNFSLRSIGEFDVAKIAMQFGGGGHKNAAGFVKPIEVWEV
ncbi:MAG: hypothetical protein EAZ85_16020 [Bacteroidetes bacterium]|nr:MAG: hypothetical protein EAZ85_16020 [Bacteroidota bacterium]TAG84857.1 MAG: hypothetical protein EAZ20_16420 [Bacteroidota bacterium]